MTRNIIVALGIGLGAWMAFDGTRALVTGAYTTPSSGEYAGQLGPWATLLSGVGIEPTSPLIKLVHLLLGIAWIVLSILQLRNPIVARAPLLVTAVLTLWYLPFGTVVGLVVGGYLLFGQPVAH